MNIISGLFVLWGLSSLVTPYLALYFLDTLASFVDITYVSPQEVYDKNINKLIQPTHIFEHIVSYQYILPVSLLLGPFAIVFSFGHMIFSLICFIPYYFHRNYTIKPIIQARELLLRF
jgi:hypothetical protein